MTSTGLLQIFLFFLVILALTKPVGLFMARLFEGERTFLHPVVRPLERLVYKLSGVDESNEQHWTHYAGSLLAFSLAGILLTYLIQRMQGMLPFNPQSFGGKLITPDLAFNTAVSFGTNTNWQAYTPETTVSYFTQALLLVSQGAIQNFHPYTKSPRWKACADHRAGTRGLAGSHQDARHQRRRILQRQLRASVREPHAVFQFLQMIFIFIIPAG
jgi:K+-transporting ATPase A subunit